MIHSISPGLPLASVAHEIDHCAERLIPCPELTVEGSKFIPNYQEFESFEHLYLQLCAFSSSTDLP